MLDRLHRLIRRRLHYLSQGQKLLPCQCRFQQQPPYLLKIVAVKGSQRWGQLGIIDKVMMGERVSVEDSPCHRWWELISWPPEQFIDGSRKWGNKLLWGVFLWNPRDLGVTHDSWMNECEHFSSFCAFWSIIRFLYSMKGYFSAIASLPH